MQDVTITRKYKHEAEQAIKDLEERGFIIVYPLTEKQSSYESRGVFNYRKGKYAMGRGLSASCWIAKLRRNV